MTNRSACPCDSGKSFSSCCEPLVSGVKRADTAEALMRSRYTSNVLKDVTYLLRTWHPSTRPADINPDTIPPYQDLRIVRSEAGGRTDDLGIVEFRARYRLQHRLHTLHEISRFIKENGQWFYINGQIVESASATGQKVGRNAPCPCGSGKKYKKCCGKA